MAPPVAAPARASGPPVPPAILAQMMQRSSAAPPGQTAQPAAGGAPPPIPPAVLQRMLALKQAQAGAPQGAAPSAPPGAPPPGQPPQGAPAGQGGPPPGQGGPPQSVPLPPGPLAGQGANPPPPALPHPGQQSRTAFAPGQMPTAMPPGLLQQMMAQRGGSPGAGGAAMGGPSAASAGANPPQLPPEVMARITGQGAQASPQAQGGAQPPDLSKVPPSVMQQMAGAKQAIANNQPLPDGPIPAPMLRAVIQHTMLLGQQVQQNGGKPPTPQQFQQAALQHVELAQGQQGAAPSAQPGLAAFAQAAQQPTGGEPPMAHAPLSEQAKQGVGGDSLMAHLTPGEISIPPALQNPQVVAALKSAFAKGGVNIEQYTAGSKESGVNPATGHPQYDWLSTLLPIAVMAGVAVFAPYLLPAAGWAIPLIVGASGAATTLAVGGTWQQAAMTGVGGAVGGYAAGLGSAGTSVAASSVAADGSAMGQAAADAAAASSASPFAAESLSAPAISGNSIAGATDSAFGASGDSALMSSGSSLDPTGFGAGSNPELAGANTGAPGQGGGFAEGAQPAPAANPSPISGSPNDKFGAAARWDPETGKMVVNAKGVAIPESKSMFGGILDKQLPFGAAPGGMGGAATIGQALYPAVGGYMASQFAPSSSSSSSSDAASQLPPGWTTHKPPASKDFGAISGSGVSNTATFADYNPYTAVTGIDPATGEAKQAGYSFFAPPGTSPIIQNGTVIQQPPSPVVNPLNPVARA